MTDVIVRPITLPDEAEALARLCWNYRSFLVPRAAHVPDMVETYYAEDDYAALIDRLPDIHKRPRGHIFVAERDGVIGGCAMYYPISETVTEIKRIYVEDTLRGTGAGHKLINACIAAAREDGYARMVLDTIHTLTEAITLYERMGFAACDPFYEPDPAYVETLRFFDLPLT